MSFGTKVVLFIIVVPILATFVWSILRQSRTTIPAGELGLLLIRGKPTDKVLQPGPHWVPALRKRQAVGYPAVEMSYRASDGANAGTSSTSPHEALGPALAVTLGDRSQAVLAYTVRFRLDPERLRTVHERFGPDGLWAVVRDHSARAMTAALAEPTCTIDDCFGTARVALEERLGAAVAAVLDADGIVMTAFSLGSVDLGRAGELIQAAVRARLELAREEAEAATRIARVRHDAELAPYLVGVGEAALRYRQTDVWRDLVQRSEAMTVAVPGISGAVSIPPDEAAASTRAEETSA
ncbi:MAG TPA: SPFH domain-containing protein [Candidatus Nanopelagicales bacterium]